MYVYMYGHTYIPIDCCLKNTKIIFNLNLRQLCSKIAYYAFRNFPKIFPIMPLYQSIMPKIMLAHFSYCIIYYKITR